MIVELRKWGSEHGIAIDSEILHELNISPKDIDSGNVQFEIEVTDKSIVLTPIGNRTKLESMFDGYKDDIRAVKVEIDWGESKGKEVW